MVVLVLVAALVFRGTLLLLVKHHAENVVRKFGEIKDHRPKLVLGLVT